jgi:hypothetical protein
MIHRFIVPFSHSQFYLSDDSDDWDPSDAWTDKAVKDHFAPMRDAIGIGTAREGGWVRVVIEVLRLRPNRRMDAWDQVVECSIAVPSGRIRLSSPQTCSTEGLLVAMQPGHYRLLVCYANFERVRRVHAENLSEYCELQRTAGTDVRKLMRLDNFRLVLWPGSRQRPRFLKRLLRA